MTDMVYNSLQHLCILLWAGYLCHQSRRLRWEVCGNGWAWWRQDVGSCDWALSINSSRCGPGKSCPVWSSVVSRCRFISTYMRMLTPRSLLWRCLYEIGATPRSKLQLLTNGFNETGMLALFVVSWTVRSSLLLPVVDISQHVWNINVGTGEFSSVLSVLPWVLPEVSLRHFPIVRLGWKLSDSTCFCLCIDGLISSMFWRRGQADDSSWDRQVWVQVSTAIAF